MEKIQKVFEKTLEAKELSKVQVGGAFSAIKTFEVLNAAADNPSDGAGVGAFLGAGIGLGAGLPLGSQMGQKLDIGGKQSGKQSKKNKSKKNNPQPSVRLKKLKKMLDQGLITKGQFKKKRQEKLKKLCLDQKLRDTMGLNSIKKTKKFELDKIGREYYKFLFNK